jgi:hypothetical protein
MVQSFAKLLCGPLRLQRLCGENPLTKTLSFKKNIESTLVEFLKWIYDR